MSKSAQAVWIDDSRQRASTAKEFRAAFIDASKEDFPDKLARLLNGERPKHVILDHILNRSHCKGDPLYRRGSTIAEAIKEQWPDCPVIGITSAQNYNEINLKTQQAYDAFFSFDNFSQQSQRILSISKGFALISKLRQATVLGLLRAPKDEHDRLHSATPTDLKRKKQDKSYASRLHDWVNRLHDRPGFLLDLLWSATLLGLNEDGFCRVQRVFKSAQYSGIFARPDDKRWWKSQLLMILYKKCPPESGELSWISGRRLPGIGPLSLSSCYACKGPFPETVAYLDKESGELRPMHLKCTALHPRFKRELYFDDIRVMQGT